MQKTNLTVKGHQ